MTDNASQREPLLVGSKEAARLLGMSQRTLYTLTDAGEIQCLRFAAAGCKKSRKWYEVAELHAFIERKRGPSR